MSAAASIAMQVISSLSAVSSFSIVLIYLRFPQLRKKSYFTLQFYVALSNVLTSIGSALGVVETGSPACWTQGIMTNVFTLSSIHWTTVMTFSLYSIVHYEKQIDVSYWVHLYCWVPPILATLLPLINSTYGNVGNWCWVVDTGKSPPWAAMFWFWFSFYGWVWGSMFAMIFLLAEIKYFSLQKTASSTSVARGKAQQHLNKIIHTLNFFPLVIFISWAPACVSDTMLTMFGVYSNAMGTAGLLFASAQGLLTAILFWARNGEVKKLIPLFFQLDAKIEGTSLSSSHAPVSSSHSVRSQSEMQSKLSVRLFGRGRSYDLSNPIGPTTPSTETTKKGAMSTGSAGTRTSASGTFGEDKDREKEKADEDNAVHEFNA